MVLLATRPLSSEADDLLDGTWLRPGLDGWWAFAQPVTTLINWMTSNSRLLDVWASGVPLCPAAFQVIAHVVVAVMTYQ